MDVFLENFRRGGRGSFPIQKITLQILLVLKRYILVVNFGKNVQNGGERGGLRQSEKFLIRSSLWANLGKNPDNSAGHLVVECVGLFFSIGPNGRSL